MPGCSAGGEVLADIDSPWAEAAVGVERVQSADVSGCCSMSWNPETWGEERSAGLAVLGPFGLSSFGEWCHGHLLFGAKHRASGSPMVTAWSWRPWSGRSSRPTDAATWVISSVAASISVSVVALTDTTPA